jgi:hypothetical protein
MIAALGRTLARTLALCAALTAGAATAVRAETAVQELARILRLDDVISVMRNEGITYGREIDADMLNGSGGTFFADRVEEIYDADEMTRTVTDALRAIMSDAEIADTLGFFDSDRGQRILALETAARVAIVDPAVEEIARETYAELKGSDDGRLAAIMRFIEINDLLERNVAGALSSRFHFYRGFVDGDGMKMDEAMILADVWRQEDEVRDDTESWLYGFLLMAYRPLSDEDLEAYSVFSETPAGQTMNAALFNGFDEVYRTISYALGLEVARAQTASDL